MNFETLGDVYLEADYKAGLMVAGYSENAIHARFVWKILIKQ
jgi:hypothetical protein